MESVLKHNQSASANFQLGVVQKLRWVFILMISVFGTAILLAVWQFHSLRAKQGELLHSSVPILVLAQSIESTFSELIFKEQEIAQAASVDDLAPIRQETRRRFDEAKTRVLALQLDPQFQEQSATLLAQMAEMEASLQKNFEIKERLLVTHQALVNLRSQISDERSVLRLELDDLAFRASLRVDRTIADVVASRNQTLEELRQILSSQSEEVALIGHLALEFEALTGVLEQLGTQESLERIGKAKSFVEFSFRRAVSSMVHISDVQNRANIAVKVSELRDLIFAQDGYLGLLEEAANLTVEFRAQSGIKKGIATSVSATTRNLLASARGYLLDVGALTERTTQRIFTILAVAAFVTGVVAVSAIYFILEKQINRRLSKLTQAVLRIASGDTEVEIDVSGRDELGRMAHALTVFKRNARELTQSNAELEKFAYVAAHDLRAPLQAILDLIEWTIEDEDTILSEINEKNLYLIRARATRLKMLLSDLLEYARTDDNPTEAELILLPELIIDTWQDLKGTESFRLSMQCDVETVSTYGDRLRTVLRNLFENSIQHHNLETGEIRVQVTEAVDRLIIKVSDDGPGISARYHEKVFELFQTLTARDEIEASGLGLAVCKKIIEHFDGFISLESHPEREKGTVFTFSFPIELTVAQQQAA